MAAGFAGFLTALILSWSYQPVSSCADPGPCDSAARAGEVFILGCRLGVWSGKADRLRLVVPCAVRDHQPNRVRALGDGRFIASTPCGLFLIEPGGEVERLPFFDSPGALDAGDGRVVLVNRSEIWRLDDALQAVLVSGPPKDLDDDSPAELQLAGDHLLVRGASRQVISLDDGTRIELPGWGEPAVFAGGRLMLVHRSGRYWDVAVGGPLGQARRLPLKHTERVSRVVPLGNRVLVLTSRRLILVQGEELTVGWLPPVAGRPVPVRESKSAGLPWMVVDGSLFRPVEDDESPAESRLGGLLQAANRHQGLELPDWSPCVAGWLPKLDLLVFGGGSRSLSLAAGNDWTYSRTRRLGFMVGLSWSLDGPLLCQDDATRLQLLRSIGKERRELEERLAGLLDIHQQHCRRGDRLGIDEAQALLFVLTGQEVTCRLE